ncbi:hypothetical protein NXS19_012515 [Fusarium pseudograminearum]|nr:hypothetical protein NXS19_012515 [Fusarium pseudograminearum]
MGVVSAEIGAHPYPRSLGADAKPSLLSSPLHKALKIDFLEGAGFSYGDSWICSGFADCSVILHACGIGTHAAETAETHFVPSEFSASDHNPTLEEAPGAGPQSFREEGEMRGIVLLSM